VKSNYKVKAFDVVRVMLTHPPLKITLFWEYPLDIVYEDDTLLLINKPGMVVHPDMETIQGL
jgi:23S rRNA pseudouridine1911/1915/1917 synthase